MALVKPSVEGRELTIAEEEANHQRHEDRIDAVIADPPTAVSISEIRAEGNVLYVDYTDASTDGPFALPRPLIRRASTFEWTGSTAYARNELVYRPGDGLYLVTVSHTSPSVWDPDHEVESVAAYEKWFPAQSSWDFAFRVGPSAPAAGEIVGIIPVPTGRDIRISADMAGAVGYVDTPPAGDYVLTVKDDGDTIGTITVSSGGVSTFSTDVNTAGSEAKDVAGGSIITVVAPDDGTAQDTTIANGVWTIPAELIIA